MLNTSSDGVSCDMENNKKMNIDYLDGDSNTVAGTDTKHNNKNARGQMVMGS